MFEYRYLGYNNQNNYFFLSIILMFKSDNCSEDTELGDSSINEDADVVFGNAMTSRILFEPYKIIINLSEPKAMPPCGGVPYFRASTKNPNLELISFLSMPNNSKIFD